MDKMKELYEKVANDSGLKAKFAEILANTDHSKSEETKKKLMDFAKEAGYSVSFEEMQDFFNRLADSEAGELSELELDSVAGGKDSGEIYKSITSLGSYCAAASIADEAKGRTCGDRFN